MRVEDEGICSLGFSIKQNIRVQKEKNRCKKVDYVYRNIKPQLLYLCTRPPKKLSIYLQKINQIQMMKNTNKAQLENLKYLIPCSVQQQLRNITINQKPKDSSSKMRKMRRSRSRRHQQQISYIDAQFSQDQQDLQTTTSEQPKKESPTKQSQKMQMKMTFNNLAYFPQGSLLSVKTCKLDIPTKIHGNAIMNVEILSEQQHKKIVSQFFDPGFDVLSIKKDKRQSQIIKYLSNPKQTLYNYIVCWFQAIQPNESDLLAAIACEANEKKRIFGWHNDHIKLHIMSLRQFNMIQGFTAPQKFASEAAAKSFRGERLVMIMQYPQRIHEIKILYDPFASITRKKQEFFAMNVQDTKETEAKIDQVTKNDQISHITECVISEVKQVQSQWYQLVKVNYQGWENVQNEQTYTIPEGVTELKVNHNEILKNNCLPERIERIRWQMGIKNMQMITSDDDNQEEQQTKVQQRQLFPLVEEVLSMFDKFQQYKSINFNYQTSNNHQQNQSNPYHINNYSTLNQHYYKDQRFHKQTQQNYYNSLLYTNNNLSNQYEQYQIYSNYYNSQVNQHTYKSQVEPNNYCQGYHHSYYQ